MTLVGDEAMQSPHRLVLASAGSGKTFALTNVYVGLLISGEDPRTLLATTFTRAAAGEMLHRALGCLSDAVLDNAALAQLRTHIDPGLTQEQCAQTLSRVIDSLHRISVMTMDAFFARLATSFSYELGLPVGWRLIDEQEDAILRAQAVDQALEQASTADFIELLRDLQGENIRLHAHQAIMEVVNQGYDAYLATLGDPAPWSAIGTVGVKLDEASLAVAHNALSKVKIPLTKADTPRKGWVKAFAKMKENVEAGDWEEFINSGPVKKLIAGESTYSGAEIEHAHAQVLEPLIDHARYVLTREHAQRTLAARRLLERFDDVYQHSKCAIGGVTFADPPRMLLAADTTGDLTHMYYRLDAQIRHVLLDEFQDTSMTQFRLFEPILDELMSQATDRRSVFCVGDAKQSLYAWRQAEPTLLAALPKKWSALRCEILSKSWRSSPAVLDAVNAIFGKVASNAAMQSSESARNAAAVWDEGFQTHVAAHCTLSGAARLTVADEPARTGDEKISDKEAGRFALETCADRVKEARQRTPGASIAVLVRKGDDLHAVLGMLKRRGIDASERRGNPLVDAPSVAAAASMLRLIDHPGNTACRRHVALTPLGAVVGLVDPTDRRSVHRVASAMRRRIAECGCAGLLSEWFVACAESMDVRGAARFEQFIDLAGVFDEAGRGGPSDLAAIVESRRMDEPGRAPVRVMTIHGAKGLEFDVVVVPLVGSVTWQVNTKSVIMGRDDPLGPVMRVSRYPKELTRSLHPELADLHAKALQKQINEELCCLYVAATRAKRCLELVVPADPDGRNGDALEADKWRLRPAHVVRAALAPDQPAGPGVTLWSSCTEDDWTKGETLCADELTSPEVEWVTLKTRPSKRRSTARLAAVSPSQIPDGKTVSAASLLTRSNRHALSLGELVHLWFEQVEWLDTGLPDDGALRCVAAHRGFGDALVKAAMPIFRRAIASEPIREMLTQSTWLSASAAAEEASVYCERLFAVRDTAGAGDRLMQGRFDRLVVGRVGGKVVRAEVMDFKTDSGAANLSGEELLVFSERHRSQMEAYRRAAASVLRLSPAFIVTTLLFTAAGATVTLPPVQCPD